MRLGNIDDAGDTALTSAAENEKTLALGLICCFQLDKLDPPDETLIPLLLALFIDPRFRNLDFFTAEARASVLLAAKRACLPHLANVHTEEEEREGQPPKRETKTESESDP